VTHGVQLALGNANTARALHDPICALYDEVFSAPPFHPKPDASQQHRRRLEDLLAGPWFGVTTATVNDELIGFAYGNRLAPTTKWWQGFLAPVPDELTAEREGRTFAVIELAVRADWRRHGVGRQLREVLLSSRGEERATLSVQPLAEESQTFYRRLGWQCVGRVVGVAGETAPFYDIYVLPLREVA
jgi:ribosomal protein S18 acetylase RimI-like enzyme